MPRTGLQPAKAGTPNVGWCLLESRQVFFDGSIIIGGEICAEESVGA